MISYRHNCKLIRSEYMNVHTLKNMNKIMNTVSIEKHVTNESRAANLPFLPSTEYAEMNGKVLVVTCSIYRHTLFRWA